jgi:vacuolar-type H+-ATPase subunit F/Vma7
MGAPVFIGDEVSAAGYRLGGARIQTPSPEKAEAVFEAARREHDLVLISVEVARMLAPAQLNAALRELQPLVLVVPDVRERFAVRDLATRLRTALGVRI